jgi:hypothetical protein
MSLTCSDVRVSDRTESPNAPRTAHVHAGLGSAQPDLWDRWDEKPQRAITNRNRFASSTSRKRGSLVVSNFVAKATNGDDSGSSSTHHARLKVAQRSWRRTFCPHSASGPTSPDGKQKSRLQVLRLFYHSIPSDGSRTDSSATAAGASTARPSAGTKMNLKKLRSQGTVNHSRAAN